MRRLGKLLWRIEDLKAAADYLQPDSRHKHGAQPGWPFPLRNGAGFVVVHRLVHADAVLADDGIARAALA